MKNLEVYDDEFEDALIFDKKPTLFHEFFLDKFMDNLNWVEYNNAVYELEDPLRDLINLPKIKGRGLYTGSYIKKLITWSPKTKHLFTDKFNNLVSDMLAEKITDKNKLLGIIKVLSEDIHTKNWNMKENIEQIGFKSYYELEGIRKKYGDIAHRIYKSFNSPWYFGKDDNNNFALVFPRHEIGANDFTYDYYGDIEYILEHILSPLGYKVNGKFTSSRWQDEYDVIDNKIFRSAT